ATLFFLPFLGAVQLFDWDEINFAESAREMLVTGNYSRVQIDFQPFWEKPPLFFWLQAASMNIFGVNEFAARFPNAMVGIITLVTFFLIGKKLYDEKFGMLWSLSMLGSFLPHLYFKSGIIDPVFNYFIFLGIYCGVHWVNKKDYAGKFAALAGLFIGLATLTKGPVALLITMLVASVYWISVRFKKIVAFKHLLLFVLIFILTAGVWFLADVMDNGIGFFNQFIQYQIDLFLHPVAGHGEPFYYHFVVVLLGCFPMSIIALPALTKNYKEPSPMQFKKWMLILFWVVMLLFSIVKTKIVHYSSLAYFPLSFLAAHVIARHIDEKKRFSGWMIFLLFLFGITFSLLLFGVPWLAQHKEILIPYLQDPFAVDCLKTEVHWNGYESVIGIAYGICVCAAVYFLLKKNLQRGILIIYISTALCLFIYLKAVVPKIEQYSQDPAIEFYQSLQGEKVYVTTFGFKSYAQYFYFRKQPGDPAESHSDDWLQKGNIDRPAYFVTKTTSMQDIEKISGTKFLYQKGGFAFYERSPNE
ncbi:MAG: ArnT family glycosyltransferase, partial [Chitinophagales bacterium]